MPAPAPPSLVSQQDSSSHCPPAPTKATWFQADPSLLLKISHGHALLLCTGAPNPTCFSRFFSYLPSLILGLPIWLLCLHAPPKHWCSLGYPESLFLPPQLSLEDFVHPPGFTYMFMMRLRRPAMTVTRTDSPILPLAMKNQVKDKKLILRPGTTDKAGQ